MVVVSHKHDLVCRELPTAPVKDGRLVLVTGAGGYIGGRLVPELLARGYHVRVMVRRRANHFRKKWPAAEIVVADAANTGQLEAALEGVDVAYYFIHSLQLGHRDFEATDIQIAENFRQACSHQKVKRIIYLGGLGNRSRGKLSPHLENRMRVGEHLAAGDVPVTVLRAGMIIGSGSASYDILKNLVVKTPVFFIPNWARTRSQPISVRAVILYLVGVMENDRTSGKTFDIGGPDILTYDEKLKVLAKLLGKRRFFFPGLIVWTSLYGYIASWLTPVPKPVTRVLVEGCKNEVICENDDIKNFVPIQLFPFRKALITALSSEEKGRVYSGWQEALPVLSEDANQLQQVSCAQNYTASYMMLTKKSVQALFRSFCDVDGADGWMRQFRKVNIVDAKRKRDGKREIITRVNDEFGPWRVEALEKDKSLLLTADLKFQGVVKLKFSIEEGDGNNKLMLKVCLEQKWTRNYLSWYNFLPLQHGVFKDLLKFIEKRSYR